MFYNYKGAKIFYELLGNGKDTIVFLHGWGCDSSIFKPIYTKLLDKYNVFLIDFPAHGKSENPLQTYNVNDFAIATNRIIESLSIDSCYVVAHSFGSRVFIKLNQIYKGEIISCILTGAAGIRPISQKSKAFTPYKFQKNMLNKLRVLKFLNDFVDKQQEFLIQKYGSEDYKALSKDMRATFVNVINEDLTDFLCEIKCPCLLIWGDQDMETPLYMAEIMKDKINDAEIIIFEGSGHFAFIQEYQRFYIILEKFFEG